MKIIIPILLFATVLFSCKDAIEELSTIGTFTSTITGNVEKQFDGQAAFVHIINESTTPNGSLLTIALSHVTDQSEIISLSISNITTDGIAAGTYKVDIQDNKGHVFFPFYETEALTYNLPVPSSVNTITLSSVADFRIKGEFAINVFDVVSNKTVKIVGTFDAAGKTETK